MTARARVVVACEGAEPLLAPGLGEARRGRVAREEVEARLRAKRITADAQAEAFALLAQARERGAVAIQQATLEAREEASARLAARWLALRQKELSVLESEDERVIALAVALAERLLGAALALDPSRIAGLALAVLDETRGARRGIVDANPLDADELKAQLANASLDLRSFEVRSDETLARGELRLHTDVGTIDARLAPRFDRLAAALRDAIE